MATKASWAGVNRALLRDGEARQHERERHEGHDDSERRTRALGVEPGKPVTEPTEQQRDADDAVERDHHGGERRIAGEGLGTLAAHHERDDERDFDDRHRDCQHEGTEGLPHPVGDHLRVVHGRQHGGHQHRRGECDGDHRERTIPGEHEGHGGDRGHRDGPPVA
jgi:hypothetical protein